MESLVSKRWVNSGHFPPLLRRGGWAVRRFGVRSLKACFLFQNVDLFDTPSNRLGLQSRLNQPLYSNYQVAAQFAMVLVGILFVLFAFQIYNKIQMGETRLVPMMTRFFLGLVLFLGLLATLNRFAGGQDFGANTTPHLQMPHLR